MLKANENEENRSERCEKYEDVDYLLTINEMMTVTNTLPSAFALSVVLSL